MDGDGDTMDVEVPGVADGSTAVDPMGTDENGQFCGEYIWHYNVEKHLAAATEKVTTEHFELGTYTWAILAFPRGNQKKHMLSLYLDAPETKMLPPSMYPKASFVFTIVNQLDETKTWSKEATHIFSTAEQDWGFGETLPISELYNEANGFMVNGEIIIKVKVTVIKDQGDSSRRETGFVGLKNQGCTCYMNSLLQYMYNLPFFRKAVYDMPTADTDDASKNMPLALQSLFFKLQYSRSTVATKDLTKSFGWNNQDAFLQHDVQELNRVLCEKLEQKMKGTRVEKVINELFEGHTTNYIKCLNIDYTSERKESYMDLQLDVKGCRNIYESFDRYTENETMDGANQYMADGHGLQDAEKGVLFESFPPVLQLQLKRFEYDFHKDMMVKINDRYEFYDELDLDREDRRYLSMQARQQPERNVYRLHSVLVHSGGVHGGHYYAFIRPDGRTWLRFDDERVTKETAQKAMDEQFGEDDTAAPLGGGYGMNAHNMRFAKHSNAYMLVYIRIDDWDRIMCPVSKAHMDPALLARFETELAAKQRRQKEKRESHMYVVVKVATDCDIRDQLASGHRAFDLVDHESLDPEKGCFRVKKHTKLGEFKEMLSESMGIDKDQFRLWVWGRRPNGTSRTTITLTRDMDNKALLDIEEFRKQGFASSGLAACKVALMDIRLYMETGGFRPPPSVKEVATPLAHRDGTGYANKPNVFVFFKHYDPFKETIQYVGKACFPHGTKAGTLADKFKQIMLLYAQNHIPPNVIVDVYEEVKAQPLMIHAMTPNTTLQDQKMEDGDILVMQPRVTEQDIAQGAKVRFPTIIDYLTYVQDRRLVLFKPLTPPPPPQASPMVGVSGNGATEDGPAAVGAEPQYPPGVHLIELQTNMTYEDVTKALAGKLGLQPPEDKAQWLRLTAHNQFTNAPQRAPLKWRNVRSLPDYFTQAVRGAEGVRGGSFSHHHNPGDILYYEILDMPLEQLELLRIIKLYFHKPSGEFVSEHVVRLPKDNCTVMQCLNEVAAQLGPTYADKELRLVEVHSSKMYKLFSANDTISDALDDQYWRLRVEVVPQEERGMDILPTALTGERLLYCCHCLPDKTAAAAGSGSSGGGNAVLPPPASAMDVTHVQGGLQGPGSPVSQPGSGDVTMSGVQGVPVLGPTYPMSVQMFNNVSTVGDPLMVACGPDDSLATIRARAQAKLGLSDEEVSKWRWFFCSPKGGVEYLTDQDSVGRRLAKASIREWNEQPFLGMEHEDDRPRRATTNHRPAAERAVKITLQ